MKTIVTPGHITRISSKADKSLGLTINTPELTSAEKAEVMELQNAYLEITLHPTDEATEEITINSDLNKKTQSQRIRDHIYVLFQKSKPDMEWEAFYEAKTNKIISFLKEQISQYE